jgi:DNA repair exonuclease SbcCD ATPase subunit
LDKVANFKKRIDKFKADNITPLDERCSQLQKELSDLKSSRQDSESELKVLEQKDIAGKKQMVGFRETRDKLKADAAARIAGYEDIDTRVAQLKADYGGRIKEAKTTLKERISRVISAATRRVADIKRKIDELKGQKRGKLKDEDAPQKELDNTEASKKNLAFEKAVHDMAIKILSDKGIKTYIIKRYIPKLNKLVNQYLEILSASYKLSFDEELKEQIALKGYDKLSYNNFSEGERQRCDIALLFAFLDIGKMKNSVTSNLLLMDEVVDRSLDDDGIRGIIDIIESMKGKGFTIVNISHKHQLADKFDKTYRATKTIFSKLEEL